MGLSPRIQGTRPAAVFNVLAGEAAYRKLQPYVSRIGPKKLAHGSK
jgi:hypothetical protein